MRHRLETIAAHAGHGSRAAGEPVAPSITPSSTFFVAEPGQHEGHGYGRISNPTRNALERSLVALEEGSSAAAFSSGCAAMHAVLQLLRPGDHMLACADIYGGTYRLIEQLVRPQGVRVSWVDMADQDSVTSAFEPNTKLVWLETPTNPLLRVFDIAALAQLAHAREALCVVDSTFATPALQQPLALGADIVVHSMSKYLNGHSDVIAGAVICGDEALGERLRFIQTAGGAVPSPFDCYLVLRGIKTLAVRMQRHCENALALAQWLQQQEQVTAVHYPGLATNRDRELAASQMSGFGGMLSFEVAGGLARARAVARGLRLFALAESLGGVESLVGLPVLMSHASMPAERREALGIAESLLRVSVGLEAFEDLRDDLEQALRGS